MGLTRSSKFDFNIYRIEPFGGTMMRVQIEETIQAAKAAVAAKSGKKTYYSPSLREAILVASQVVGPIAFSKETGVPHSLIAQWKRSIRLKKRARVDKDCKASFESGTHTRVTRETDSFGAREIVVRQDVVSMRGIGTAVIRSGRQFEIEVPVELITPAWVSGLVQALDSGKGGSHV